ncbi:MAG: hypothetical protein ACOY3J_04125 [Bacillota bacterium]|uniref:Uncharacterized protein n=1 Tax=Thermanaerosceptrum fracticalcis TaxID=1712410 RepID=A0A7G6E3V9_THEFR|nr:hypothetical protein [Thermanaerosceptrum fracticalcis]MBZ4654069.1 hypothetical protein [Peptococcaceae bacterium]QNB46763.1 hypothetical protein BR63_10865 [Thermanaerosceptrum fracticalcis]
MSSEFKNILSIILFGDNKEHKDDDVNLPKLLNLLKEQENKTKYYLEKLDHYIIQLRDDQFAGNIPEAQKLFMAEQIAYLEKQKLTLIQDLENLLLWKERLNYYLLTTKINSIHLDNLDLELRLLQINNLK